MDIEECKFHVIRMIRDSEDKKTLLKTLRSSVCFITVNLEDDKNDSGSKAD